MACTVEIRMVVDLDDWSVEAIWDTVYHHCIPRTHKNLAKATAVAAEEYLQERFNLDGIRLLASVTKPSPSPVSEYQLEAEESDGQTLAELWSCMEVGDREEFLERIEAERLKQGHEWRVDPFKPLGEEYVTP